MEGIGNHHWKDLQTEEDWDMYLKYLEHLPEEDLKAIIKKQTEEIMEKLKLLANE